MFVGIVLLQITITLLMLIEMVYMFNVFIFQCSSLTCTLFHLLQVEFPFFNAKISCSHFFFLYSLFYYLFFMNSLFMLHCILVYFFYNLFLIDYETRFLHDIFSSGDNIIGT